jgi:hypothetical protein
MYSEKQATLSRDADCDGGLIAAVERV